MRRRWLILLVAFSAVLAALCFLIDPVRREVIARLGRVSVTERVAEIQDRVSPLWASRCGPTSIDELQHVTLIAIKSERALHVVGHTPHGPRFLARYPILAASGEPGPKLREGDRQVPEGVYAITFLNPNSRYRLSMRLNYPSDADIEGARSDGRDPGNLGGDIMIHGSDKSVGCLAMGDPAIEELFWLAAEVGIEKMEVLISPDRHPEERVTPHMPAWLAARYDGLAQRLRAFSLPRVVD